MVFAFDEHSLDTERRELRRNGLLVAVEPKVFDVLEYLIAQRARVVAKDELLAAVWQGRVISDSTLSSQIAALRRAVGDSGESQRVIRTVARKGFRFVGALQEAPAMTAAAASSTPERRPLTVLACRVTLPPGLDPEDFGDVVRRCQRAVDEIVAPMGGWVARHTSDGAIVGFGYPQAGEDDAERAVRAGLHVVRGLYDASGAALTAGVQAGIASGMFVVGEHDATTSSYAALDGESLQVALRLMERAPANALVIAESTRRSVGRLFELSALAPPPGNGSAEEVGSMWTVLGESLIASRFQALRSIETPLIGRDEEMSLLERRWQQVQSGEGRVVLVCGEPGIGKSRLVAEFGNAIRSQRHVALSFYCAPHRMQTALYPVIAHIEETAGFAGGDDTDTKREKLSRWLAHGGVHDANDVALFADLLSISTSPAAALSLSAQRRKEMLLERFTEHMARESSRAPALVVLEDAHWVDRATRELFDLLIERSRTLPMLLVMTYRPEFPQSWVGQSHVTALTLNRLARQDNSILVQRIAGGRTLPPALLERIIASSDGVPLFIEEVTKAILESGMVRAAGAGYELADERSALVVPPTLQASLAARIDGLPSVRALIQTCAAIGRQFEYRVLRAVTGVADAELKPLLEHLVASGLVHQRGTAPDATYLFKHALIQDSAYETMLKGQRTRVHRRIANVLEAEFPEIPARHPDLLAHHCTQGGLWPRAIVYSIAAARMALERSAGIEAQGRVQTAMSLLAKVTNGPAREQLEGRLQVALADALIMTEGFASPAVMAALTRAGAILDERAHPADALRALCALYNYHLIRSESPRCLVLTLPLLERAADRPTRTIANYLVGTAHLHLGNFAETIRHLRKAAELYDEDACRDVAFVAGYHLRSFTLIWLGLAYLYVGESDAAAATIADAVADARSRRHPFTLVSALLAQSRFCSHRGDLAGARAASDEGLAVATAQRSPYHVSRANILRAINMVDRGDCRSGIALLEASLIAHRATGANFQSAYNLSRLAEAYAGIERFDHALALADAAIAEVERSGERWWLAEAQRIRGELLLRGPAPARAEAMRCFDRALDVARSLGARLWEENALRSRRQSRTQRGRSTVGRATRQSHPDGV